MAGAAPRGVGRRRKPGSRQGCCGCARRVLRFDPATNETSLIGGDVGGQTALKWMHGVLAAASAGRLQAASHRVAKPPPERRAEARLAVVFEMRAPGML